MLIAVKEEKHDRDHAESTAEKDGGVSHIITERHILQRCDLHWSTVQCEIIGSSVIHQDGWLELLMMSFFFYAQLLCLLPVFKMNKWDENSREKAKDKVVIVVGGHSAAWASSYACSCVCPG